MSQGEAGASSGAGLVAALQRMGGHVLELLQVRLELLGTEIEAQKLRLLAGLLTLLLALLFAAAALALLSVAVLLLAPAEWRWAAALLLGLGHAFVAYGLWRRALGKINSPGGPFALTTAELARDRDAMGG